MARLAIKGAIALEPLFLRMKQIYLSYDFASLDATWFNVLKSKQGPGKRACIWSFDGGPPGKEVVLFGYQKESEKQVYLKNFFGRYLGTMMCDGDPSYMQIEAAIGWILACCNSHARRKFEPLAKRTKTRGLVHDFMDLYTRIYLLEAEAVESKLNQVEHTIWREQKMRPVFEEFHKLLKAEFDSVQKNSELWKAMNYCINYWPYLTRCLTDSRIKLDTNHVERIIRKFVIGRNNYLFSDTDGGAEALCLYYSLIQTARLHGLNERKYLEYLIINVPGRNPNILTDFDSLLPWNLNKDFINNSLPSPTGWD